MHFLDRVLPCQLLVSNAENIINLTSHYFHESLHILPIKFYFVLQVRKEWSASQLPQLSYGLLSPQRTPFVLPTFLSLGYVILKL